MPVFLDLPGTQVEGFPFAVAGWIASHAAKPAVSLRVGGTPVPFTFQDRPDVRAVLTGFPTVSGIVAVARLECAWLDGPVAVELECDGEVAVRSCRITGPQARWASRAQKDLLAKARQWCMGRLQCPTCGAGAARLSHAAQAIRCGACGQSYAQDGRALNMISEMAGIAAGVMESENVSSNPYTPEALALIATTTGRGGWVLDCGAGSRPERLPGVINVEIAPYRSTDVLAIGEALPFADDSFDAVLSLAVLEHVRDPFACARELVRVLKPGGELIADVPFMQPVHGYPNHYYNMTASGLRNLFEGLGDVLAVLVPAHGHPIFGVQWMLAAYLAGLPEAARAQFAAMTVGELAAVRPHEFLPTPAASLLSAEAQQVVACVNMLRLRKGLSRA